MQRNPIRSAFHAPSECSEELARLFARRDPLRDTRPASAFLPVPDSLVRLFAREA